MATVRIISRDNDVGLSQDMDLVAGVMREAGHDVEVIGYRGSQIGNRLLEGRLWLQKMRRSRVDLQIFLERVYHRCLPLAKRNVLVPNPEWFSSKWERFLPQFDRVICKTEHAEALFRELGCSVRHTGFTSRDLLDADVPRETRFFHLAGRSVAKGTRAVIEAWELHPEWPGLTVLQHPSMVDRPSRASNVTHIVDYVDTTTLRRMQNSHRFHLCPSETEGFGHYIVEGMGVGAVMLVTDGPPMRELVTPQTGLLIPTTRRERRGAVDHFLVDVDAIEATVEAALALDLQECEALGNAARAAFVERDRSFRSGFATACFDT